MIRDRPNNKDFTKIMANLTLKQKIKPVGQMVHGKILGNIQLCMPMELS